MPFDAMLKTQEIDELSAIGVVPVPDDVLVRYKAEVLQRTKITHPLARWLSMPLTADRIGKQLGQLRRIASHELSWASAAPYRVRRLAERVRDAIPEAKFRVGYIYRDPYLLVKYGEPTDPRSACLAIWRSRFSLVAIAQQNRRRW